MRSTLRLSSAAALALGLTSMLADLSAQLHPAPSPALAVADQTLGSPAPTVLSLGHTVSFDLTGAEPGTIACLLASLAGPAVPFDLAGVPVIIDPSAFLVLGVRTVGSSGQATFDLTVPLSLQGGQSVHAQVFLLAPEGLAVQATEGLALPVASEAYKMLLWGSISYHPLASSGGALTITNAADWQAFWLAHSLPWGLPSSPPTVDFGTSAVLCTFAGAQQNTAYSFGLDAVVYAGSGLLAKGTVYEPGPGCAGGEMLIYPYVLVLVDAAVGAPAQLTKAVAQGPACE